MKWLITGANGFTAKHLYSFLKNNNHEVYLISRSGDSAIKCDLSDQEAVVNVIKKIQPNRVVHLAGVYGLDPGLNELFYDVHVKQTENLIRACAAMSCPPVIVLASSAHVYGNREGKLVEDDKPAPIGHYAISKMHMEIMAQKWTSELPIYIARSFNYTGRGQAENFIIPKIIEHFKKRVPQLTLGDISVERDFSDVRDIVQYYIALFNAGQVGQTVNFCSGNLMSIAKVISHCQEITGHHLEVVLGPHLIRPQEIKKLYGCSDKLYRLTRCRPVYNIRQTLEDMLSVK
jgi:nucleoside-diphosphate-sugar epimerase